MLGKKSREDDLLLKWTRLREKLPFVQKTKFLTLWNVDIDLDDDDIDHLDVCEWWDRYNQEVLLRGANFFPGHQLMIEAYSSMSRFEPSKHKSFLLLNTQLPGFLTIDGVWKCHESLTGLKPPPHPFSIAEQEQARILTDLIDEINHRIRTLTHQSNHSTHASRKQTIPITIKSWIILASHVIYTTQRLSPFIDGNKRMAELLGNYVLTQHNRLPFVVSIFDDDQPQGFHYSYMFHSHGEIIRLLSFQIATKWKEYDSMSAAISQSMTISGRRADGNRNIHRKTDDDGVNTSVLSSSTDVQSSERAVVEARAALRKEGVCAICLMPSPTLSTLCCGLPLHLNCLITWRRKRNQQQSQNCPHCRQEIEARCSRTTMDDDESTSDSDDDEGFLGMHDDDFSETSETDVDDDDDDDEDDDDENESHSTLTLLPALDARNQNDDTSSDDELDDNGFSQYTHNIQRMHRNNVPPHSLIHSHDESDDEAMERLRGIQLGHNDRSTPSVVPIIPSVATMNPHRNGDDSDSEPAMRLRGRVTPPSLPYPPFRFSFSHHAQRMQALLGEGQEEALLLALLDNAKFVPSTPCGEGLPVPTPFPIHLQQPSSSSTGNVLELVTNITNIDEENGDGNDSHQHPSSSSQTITITTTTDVPSLAGADTRDVSSSSEIVMKETSFGRSLRPDDGSLMAGLPTSQCSKGLDNDVEDDEEEDDEEDDEEEDEDDDDDDDDEKER